MAAEGKLSTARLTQGARILVVRNSDDMLSKATKRTGSLIATVQRSEPMGGGRRAVRTDIGILVAWGKETVFVANERDEKRAAKEAAQAGEAAADGAAVLDGVTGADLPRWSRVKGTVKVDGKLCTAEQGTDGVMRYRTAAGRTRKATDAIALTFVKHPAMAPTDKAQDDFLADAERAATERLAKTAAAVAATDARQAAAQAAEALAAVRQAAAEGLAAKLGGTAVTTPDGAVKVTVTGASADNFLALAHSAPTPNARAFWAAKAEAASAS